MTTVDLIHLELDGIPANRLAEIAEQPLREE